VLFGVLMAIRAAFSMGVDMAGQGRLMVIDKVSIINPLPASYEGQIKQVEGVTATTHANWFGGYYQDVRNQFATFAVDPETWLDIYSKEFEITQEQRKAWIADRTGAIVGADTAKKYGFTVGQRVPINGTIYRRPDGGPWEFTIDGIYDSKIKGADKTNFLFRYDYLDENRRGAYGQVGWYIIKIDDPTQAATMAAKLDSQFANSSAETKTSTEKAFLQGFVNQIGDVGAIMVAILIAVLFSILLVAANTMSQAVRERTNELAVLKTLGFSNGLVLTLVLAESLFMALLGGGIALALAWVVISRGSLNSAFLPVFLLRGRDVFVGVALCFLLGSLAGALPAVSAMRLRVTDALRRN